MGSERREAARVRSLTCLRDGDFRGSFFLIFGKSDWIGVDRGFEACAVGRFLKNWVGVLGKLKARSV